MTDNGLYRLNRMSRPDALKALTRCCGSSSWILRMLSRRPFESRAELLRISSATFRSLTESDWREAFARHPKIGDLRAVDRSGESKWAAQEQASTMNASADVLKELAEANQLYEQQFGRTYIVCATGLEPADMIADLKRRLGHDPHQEFAIAADHQRRITKIRLKKLLDTLASDASDVEGG
ncbi:MAG: 2-oxo-4-hydroxy-4-carboxy-5-ureidoimidazoline decarboxylase [Rhodothermia bacterium]